MGPHSKDKTKATSVPPAARNAAGAQHYVVYGHKPS